ncbi:MAG: SDR family NAD(P)-dependent oxidoreductase [Oscillospiraceae bacterium]|nr:SDR family NAD(P)-dependent oxidoreductase [Oscillospiraceae bacterium]
MSIKNWIKQNTENLEGKKVAVSGSTGGIGRELCKILVGLGADLVCLDRNAQKVADLQKTLLKERPNLSLCHVPLDLENVDSVRTAAEALKEIKPDVLILNAGAYHIPRKKSALGLENVFQINFLSPYFLVRELMDLGVKVVAVSSIAHNYSKVDESDIDFARRTKPSLIYGNSKRFLQFALYRLFEGSDKLSVVHPGITFTNITAHYPPLIFAIIKHPMKVIFMRPKKAALSIVKGVFDSTNQNEWIGPCLFDVWGLPKKKRVNTCGEKEGDFIFSTAEKFYNNMKKAN